MPLIELPRPRSPRREIPGYLPAVSSEVCSSPPRSLRGRPRWGTWILVWYQTTRFIFSNTSSREGLCKTVATTLPADLKKIQSVKYSHTEPTMFLDSVLQNEHELVRGDTSRKQSGILKKTTAIVYHINFHFSTGIIPSKFLPDDSVACCCSWVKEGDSR